MAILPSLSHSSFPSELFLSLPSFYAEQLSLGCVLICLGIYIYISEMRGGGKLYEEISASIYLGGGECSVVDMGSILLMMIIITATNDYVVISFVLATSTK